MGYTKITILLLYFVWPVALAFITILWIKSSWRALALRCSIAALLALPLGWWLGVSDEFRKIYVGAFVSAATLIVLGHQLVQQLKQTWRRMNRLGK